MAGEGRIGPAASSDGAGSVADDEMFNSFLSFLSSGTPPPPRADGGGDETKSSSPPVAAASTSSDSISAPSSSASAAASGAIQPRRVDDAVSPPKERGGCEAVGDKVDETISSFFYRVGLFCSSRPRTTIALSLGVSILCAMGMAKLNTENRPEKLWVPQNTQGEVEQEMYLGYFPPSSRFQTVIVTSAAEGGGDVLTKSHLLDAMKMHEAIGSGVSTHDGANLTFADLCTPGFRTCATFDWSDPNRNPICQCLAVSVLKVWNYDADALEADPDVLGTLNGYGSRDDLEKVLGAPKFDPDTGRLMSAEAMSMSYFLEDRSEVVGGNTEDPVNEAWEESVFLRTVQDGDRFPNVNLAYLSSRSFNDEFGSEIQGDLPYVNISYMVAFMFLGATLGTKICGRGSRWAMSYSALMIIAMATVAGFGIASLIGLIYGPVHSILPFVLLGIGVDDAFVIANAFDREREGVPRESEDDEALVKRGARSLARAGASITVTSLTDLVAFAISSTSALPALASFCAYASINIFFLWALAATFFTATMVIDERRQRENRRDCLCCVTRKANPDEEDTGAEEGRIPTYFRRYHAPAILSPSGKLATLAFFAALFVFGLYGMIKLPVEDSARNFIPQDSYIKTFSTVSDEYFPTSGSLYITFEGGEAIYESRVQLAALGERVSGKSGEPPYIAEPSNDMTYRNVMTGLRDHLAAGLGSVELGPDGWPSTYEGFLKALKEYADFPFPGRVYAGDVAPRAQEMIDLEAIRVELEYVGLTKEFRGETIDDSARQIKSMDATREMIESWTDLPPAFPYSNRYIAIEGFKIIGTELYRNVGLAIACVGLIVLCTVANFVTAAIITINVAFCIIEILGFMYAIGIVIDSVSVINVVLAVGLSIDYSAHIGHCFMVKGGDSRDDRATEALADIGSSVLNGALSTFLAVAVLLFSTSYVFKTLSTQFALTVGLGVLHGVVLLPVLLSLFGPAPFASAEPPHKAGGDETAIEAAKDKKGHPELDRGETVGAVSFGIPEGPEVGRD